MSVLARGFKDSSWLFGARLAGAGLQAITLAAFARASGPAEFGMVVAVQGVIVVFSAVAGLGLGPHSLRTYARQGSINVKAIVLNRRASAALLGVLATLFVVCDVLFEVPGFRTISLLPLAVVAASDKNTELWSNLAIASGSVKLVALAQLLNRLFMLACFLLLNAMTPDATLSYTSAIAAGAIVANTLMRTKLRRRIATDSVADDTRRLLREARPFLLNTIGAQLRNLDVALVAAIGGPSVSGSYALPARLISPLRMAPNALAPVLLRLSSSRDVNVSRVAFRLVRYTLIASVFGLLVVALAAPWIIVPLLGEQYASAVTPLQILCVGLVFAFAVTLFTSVLQGLGEETAVGRAAIAANLLSLVLVSVGAMFGVAEGAAAGLAVAYIVHSAWLGIRLSKHVRRRR